MPSALFHALTYREPRDKSDAQRVEYDENSARRFPGRFAGHLDYSGKSVLDVGCGAGALCVDAARRGARQVTGVDLAVDMARQHVSERGADVAAKIELIPTDGSLAELGDRRFDLVLSKDSFEHYADPERFLKALTNLVAAGGELAIGFGPLWKAPWGGHITYMTPLPWAHLLFSEQVIMAERRRFRPHENATRWSEVRGGLNQMTLKRFLRIIETSGLERTYLATNVSDQSSIKVMKAFSRIPGLHEYFTQNVFTILRKPA